MADEIPIIFIHYGPSAYLWRTLRAAQRSNPGKKIYFLGDETNRRFCPRGVEFAPFEMFSTSRKLRMFRTVFQPIEGARHRFKKHGGTARWLAFVFERWFVIEAFISSREIRRFWTFDSDTMIAADLAAREQRFAGYQATEQCRGDCLNGLVNDVDVIGEYTAGMTELFGDADYLELQRSRLQKNAGLCFNEMDAWKHFKSSRALSVCALGTPRDGEAFDDALGIVDGWVPAARKVGDRIPVKKVMIDKRGAAFAFHGADEAPVRLVTLNLSWLPDYMFDRARRACTPAGFLEFRPSLCRPLGVLPPLPLEVCSKLGQYLRRAGFAARHSLAAL